MKRALATLAVGVAIAIAVAAVLRLNTDGAPAVANAAFTPPPTTGTYLALDCDLGVAGIQDDCTLPAGTASWDVGIVLGNVDVPGVNVGAFALDVVGDNQFTFNPSLIVGGNLDRNPDFADLSVGTWSCAPVRDLDPSPLTTTSRLSCWVSDLGMPLASPSETLLATLRVDVHGGGAGTFVLNNVSVGTGGGIAIASCNPVVSIESLCVGASTNSLGLPATATPTPTATHTPTSTATLFPGQPTPTYTPTPGPTITTPATGTYLGLDCAPSTPGIQYACALPPGQQLVTIDVVFGNVDYDGENIGAFNFEVLGSNQPVFDPPPGFDAELNANPDFNEPHAGAMGTWQCDPPPPDNDRDTSSSTTDSFLSCWAFDIGNPMPAGTSKVLATLQLNVVGTGTGTFTPANLSVGNYLGVELGSCNPVSTTEAACFGATLISVPCSDLDCDNIPDLDDNCVTASNGTQANTDRNDIWLQPARAFDDITRANSDSLGDACDEDDDNDGLTDADEASGAACGGVVTDAIMGDTDGDRMLDGAECVLGTDPLTPNAAAATCHAGPDADGDAIIAGREFCYYGTSDSNINSDGDNCSDRREIMSINADLAVNAIDLSQVAQAFGPYAIGAPAYFYDFDVTKDGSISAIDLMQVAQAFGACP